MNQKMRKTRGELEVAIIGVQDRKLTAEDAGTVSREKTDSERNRSTQHRRFRIPIEQTL